MYCVDKHGPWRSACGRSPVSFYPGWDGRLARKDSDSLLKDKHFLSCSSPGVDHLCRFPTIREHLFILSVNILWVVLHERLDVEGGR